MATRLSLRDSAPTNDPGETERSVALPVGDFQDFAGAVKSLSTTKGSSDPEASISGSSQAHTDHDDDFFTSFSSEALDAQTITAQTWTIAIVFDEGSLQANSFMVLSVYVFREPSTVVGFIYDSDTALGNEWPSVKAGRVATFSGSAVTAQAGDYIVLEVWRHTAGQGMSMSYTQEMFYDGDTDVTEDGTNLAASYLETPQDLTFTAGPAAARRRGGFGGGRAITL